MLILLTQKFKLGNLTQTHAVYVGNFADSGVMCKVCFQAVMCWFVAAYVTVGRASVRGKQKHYNNECEISLNLHFSLTHLVD
jgi:hypothetical protein